MARTVRLTRTERLSLAALVVAALAIRMARIGFQSLWRDEVDAIRFATQPLGDLMRMFLTPGENGPLYFLALRPWLAVFGEGEAGLRSFSVVAGAALVPLMFHLGGTAVQQAGRVAGRGLDGRRALRGVVLARGQDVRLGRAAGNGEFRPAVVGTGGRAVVGLGGVRAHDYPLAARPLPDGTADSHVRAGVPGGAAALATAVEGIRGKFGPDNPALPRVRRLAGAGAAVRISHRPPLRAVPSSIGERPVRLQRRGAARRHILGAGPVPAVPAGGVGASDGKRERTRFRADGF